jgi:hypothetical protein
MIQKQGTIQGMETQWFPVSQEVQDTNVIKQGVGVCLLGQRILFLQDNEGPRRVTIIH